MVLPGGTAVTRPQLALAATALALLIWLMSSWSVLLLVANLVGGGYYGLKRREGGVRTGGSVSKRRSRRRGGIWRVTLVKAEIVKDEPWSGEYHQVRVSVLVLPL